MGFQKSGLPAITGAILVINNVIFNDLDVVKGSDDGAGGAILTDLTTLIFKQYYYEFRCTWYQ